MLKNVISPVSKSGAGNSVTVRSRPWLYPYKSIGYIHNLHSGNIYIVGLFFMKLHK